MLKSEKKGLGLRFLILGLLVSCLILLSTSAARTLFSFSRDVAQNDAPRSTTQKPGKFDIPATQTDDRPIVDYDGASANPITPKRKAKGDRYDGKRVVKDVDTGGTPVLAFSHWDAALSALPVRRSGMVVLGQIVSAKAYLSNDKTGVYSEFAISVERVFKDDKSNPSFYGQVVTAERWGGRVKFPSGRVLLFGNRGQGMPQVGTRYLFFLESNPQQYNILTAYSLLSGRVHPLDGKSALGGKFSEWPGNAYEGANAEDFLNEVETAVKQSLIMSK